MINALPRAKALLADRGYDADWFRHALAERGIAACIPSKTNRKTPIPHDTGLYRQRHEVENMFGELKPVLSLPKGTGDASTPVTTDAHTHWLRRPSGHVRHLHRRNRHLLAAAMRPEPRFWAIGNSNSLPSGIGQPARRRRFRHTLFLPVVVMSGTISRCQKRHGGLWQNQKLNPVNERRWVKSCHCSDQTTDGALHSL